MFSETRQMEKYTSPHAPGVKRHLSQHVLIASLLQKKSLKVLRSGEIGTTQHTPFVFLSPKTHSHKETQEHRPTQESHTTFKSPQVDHR